MIMIPHDKGISKEKSTGQYHKYFTADYTAEQIEGVIINLLKKWRADKNIFIEKD